MILHYFDLPMGGQLLILTSRLLIYGSCRSNPNKYNLIDNAYSKVGIYEGSQILKAFIKILRNKENFNIQPLCKINVADDEINLVRCIEAFKYDTLNEDEFMKLWNLENEEKHAFYYYGRKLAKSFIKANLNTNVDFKNEKFLNFKSGNLNYETRH